MTIQEAKDFLKSQGYYTDNLWCVDDVKSSFNCTDEQAQEVLDGALNNDATTEQVWFAINFHAEEIGLVKDSEEEENEKFARKCSITGEGINKGYVIGDGDFYIKDDSALAEKYILENTKYKDINDAYADEFYYWTEWEDEDDYQYEMINGVLTEIE